MYCRVCGTEGIHIEDCANCGSPLESGLSFCNDRAQAKVNQEMCTSCQNRLSSVGEIRYAGFWIRAAAILVDCLVVSIPIVIVLIIYLDYSYDSNFDKVGVGLTLYVAVLIALLIYNAGMHASIWQATVGKRLLGINVTTVTGERISFLRGMGRYLATLLSGILYIGYILAGFTEKKQALHDVIAGTVVVYGKIEE
jgi:uncharacterized RDD family membrane protein YckC